MTLSKYQSFVRSFVGILAVFNVLISVNQRHSEYQYLTKNGPDMYAQTYGKTYKRPSMMGTYPDDRFGQRERPGPQIIVKQADFSQPVYQRRGKQNSSFHQVSSPR